MRFHKNHSKDIRKTLFTIMTMISIITMLFVASENDAGNRVGLLFVFGLPLLLYCYSFYRRLILIPFEGEISHSGFYFTFFNHREETISMDQIIKINVLVRSKRTAVIEFLYKDANNKFITMYINKEFYVDFIDMCSAIEGVSQDNFLFRIYDVKDIIGKERTPYDNELCYQDYLTIENNTVEKFKEILFEKKIKGILIFLGIITLAYLKSSDGLSIKLMISILIPFVIVYQIVSIILRIKGYNRKEAMEYIFVFFLFLFFGVTSYVMNIVTLVKLLGN